MESEALTMEEKCQNLMNVVVESRKQYGKRCIEYEQKISLMENKMLNLQLETVSNSRFKSKNTIQNLNVDDMCKDIDDFANEIVARKKRIDLIRKKVRDTQNIVLQLNHDSVGKKVKQPLSAEALLAQAKAKQNIGIKSDTVHC